MFLLLSVIRFPLSIKENPIAPIEIARLSGSSWLTIRIVLSFGAPVIDPQGKTARIMSEIDVFGRKFPVTVETR